MSLRKSYQPLFFAFIIILYVVPVFVRGDFILHLCYLIFLNAILAQAFNIMAGFTGYLTLGHSAFFGVGAYATAVFTLNGMPPYLAIVIGGLTAAVFALPTYCPLFNLRGAYFAISTLAITQILNLIIRQPFIGLGASVGLTLPLPSTYSKIPYYYISLTLMLLTLTATYKMMRSKLGLGLISIREDEDVCTHFGVKPLKLKLISLAISALFTGMAGGLYANYMFYINPETVFSTMLSLQMQFMPIVGGLGTIVGPIIGAVILTGLSEMFSYTLGELSLFIYGASVIIVMRFMPEGVWGFLKERIHFLKRAET